MKAGLRTEIVVNIVVLLGAALLFAGFLLVKLTEHELLEQQRSNARTTLDLVVNMLSRPSQDRPLVSPRQHASDILGALDSQPDILAWRLLDADLELVAGLTTEAQPGFEDIVPAILSRGEVQESLSYSSGWLPWQQLPTNSLDLTTVIFYDEVQAGLLQVRFSLKNIVARVHRAQRLMAFYVVAYGLVLAAFGVYLLNRNVVRPILRLQQATAEVADGSLGEVEIGRGPGEITELASSFNRMVVNLKTSRSETLAHIRSLEQANHALKQARDDLVHSEKMASVGHLAAGMAHEIGNPLGALTGYLGMLQADLGQTEQLDLIKRAQTETARIDKLIRELLDYAAPGNQLNESFSPGEALHETVTMLEHQGVWEGIVVKENAIDSRNLVNMDRRRFQQVWVNLLLNARDAMGGVGEITLSLTKEDDWLKLSITDHGTGMTPAQQKQIFEPFYTTKDPGKGRGLGLAVCQRIVDEAGGWIDVVSQAGQGTTFTVSLPVTKEA